ncbi:MAG: hypothetical protein ABIT38_17620, partial [Gemmatimonadaceae bacterium]
MLTLAIDAIRNELVERLGRLTPDSARRWGTLTAPEALRHMIDSFDGVTGKRELSQKTSFISRTLFRYVALRLP